MTVHFITTSCDMAQGRFLGPVALLREAARLLPELRPMLTFEWEWRGWIDLVEGTGAVCPVLRWRVPPSALQRLWDRHDGREPRAAAADDAAARAVAAMRRFEFAKAVWGRTGFATQHQHPLDDPRDGADGFLERPSELPWSPRTYDAVPIERGDGLLVQDDHGCVPLFRQWQALLIVELALAGPRTLGGLRRGPLREIWPNLAAGRDEWHPWADLRGFDEHRAALEALSWNSAYRQHALMLAGSEKPDLGLFAGVGVGAGADTGGEFVIRGASHANLIAAEEAVARESLARHGLDERRVLDAATWLGWSSVRRRDLGHVAAGRAYANLMRDAVELLISMGHTLSEVQGSMRDGAALVGGLFPVWLDRARVTLKGWVGAMARDFDVLPEPLLPAFDVARVDQFVEWLEGAGLFAAHMSIPAISEYGKRTDRDAQVGVGMHLSSLAAWVEHVCNEALGSGWTGGNTLYFKLRGCWARHGLRTQLDAAFEQRRTADNMSFADAVKAVLAAGADTKAEWMARDARLARLIRNKGLHRGLVDLDRSEARDAACILLRTAMGVWLTCVDPASGSSPP